MINIIRKKSRFNENYPNIKTLLKINCFTKKIYSISCGDRSKYILGTNSFVWRSSMSRNGTSSIKSTYVDTIHWI